MNAMSFIGGPPAPASNALASVRPKTRFSPALQLWLILGATGLAGLWLGLQASPPRMDPELVPLLRFMAVLKAGMAIGAAALAQWRLQSPTGVPLKLALLGSTALMISAPGLIWGLNHLVVGAVVFHAGLLIFLVAAARDGFGIRVRKLGQQ
jgi:hypothetical protein